MDTISGLPWHPLLVHGVVVLGPLAALLLVAYVAKPTWRGGLKWPTVVLAVGSAALSKLAEASGEELQHRVMGAGGAADQLIRKHAEPGELAGASLALLALATLVSIFYLVPVKGPRAFVEGKSRGMFGTIALASAIVAALFVGYAVIDAGHTGATSVWSSVISSTN